MPRHVEMQDTPPIMANYEEAIEHPKGDGRNGEEIHGCDSFSMIAQEGEPPFRKLRISWRFAHPPRDGSFGDIESEHEKLPVNARCSPRRILGHHLKDQSTNLLRNSSSADMPTEPGNEAPVELKPSLVPPNNGFRKNDDKELSPVGPELTCREPEQFVGQPKFGSRMATLKDCQLLSQDKIFQQEAATPAKEASDGVENEP